MVEVDFSGDYLSVANTEDGDIVTILDEGKFEDFEKDGAKKKIFNISVEVNQKQKTYSPWDREGMKMSEAWGNDTKAWVGKQFKVKHVSYMSFGQEKVKLGIEPIYE